MSMWQPGLIEKLIEKLFGLLKKKKKNKKVTLFLKMPWFFDDQGFGCRVLHFLKFSL